MNELDTRAFESLFKEAFEKCFGYPLKESLTETESKLFLQKISTRPAWSWDGKAKNYSSFIVEGPDVKPENPSIATLDTLSRYVVAAPYSSETERKEKESHYPYWFGYKEKFHRSSTKEPVAVRSGTRRQVILTTGFFLTVIHNFHQESLRPGSFPRKISMI
jgi:hypothetical protein